tara:strand:+ start:900 stop:2456 length:1557 start_codon:yes stop_codon:yes gene_type:complete
MKQERFNPSTDVSNWQGRSDYLKGYPGQAMSAALNGGFFGAGKQYWALMFQTYPGGSRTESTFRGMDVDSEDNVYVAFVDNSGEEGRIAKFEQSGGMPTLAASVGLDNTVPTGNVTCWNDSGTEIISLSGAKNNQSESCYIYSIGKDLSTDVNSGRSAGIYINSGENNSMSHDQTELSSTGVLNWCSMDMFSYFGWYCVQGGVWLETGWSIGQTGSTYAPSTGISADNTQIGTASAFQWGADRWGIAGKYGTQPWIVGNYNTNGNTQTGSTYEYSGWDNNFSGAKGSLACNTNETNDPAYWLITNPHPSNQSVYFAKLPVNNPTSPTWVRKISGGQMYGPGQTGSVGNTTGTPCRPLIDSNDNIYIAWGDRVSGSSGADRASIAKYNSSGTLQWSNTIVINTGTATNWFNPHSLRLSADEEDLYITIERGRPNSSYSGSGMLFKVPADGTLTSSDAVSIDGGTFTYNTQTYTEAAGSLTVALNSSSGWSTSTSQTTATNGFPTESSFDSNLATSEIEG